LQDLDDFDEAGHGNHDVSMTCIGEIFCNNDWRNTFKCYKSENQETPIVTALRQEAEERESVDVKSVIEIGSSNNENSEHYEESHHNS
jgi:hypothetical protein